MYNARMPQTPELEGLKRKLQLERDKLLTAVRAFSTPELLQPYPNGWSVKELLAHVANAEALNVKFARLMIETERPIQIHAMASDYPDYVGEFELHRFNAYMTEKLRAKSLDAVLRELHATRAATLAWLETLTAEDLERRGQHAAWGEQSVRGMIKILMLHDKTHAQELAQRARGGN